jgi:hypothetical protein
MPAPSYYPVVVGLGLALGASGLIVSNEIKIFGAVIALGLAIALIGIYGWAFEPVAPKEHSHK